MSKALDQLKTAIQQSGRSMNELAKASKVSKGGISRLLSGERGLGVEAMERIADALTMEVRLVAKRRRAR